jgi:hypothetical protein
MRIKKEISGIISTLKNSVKKHRIDRNFASRMENRYYSKRVAVNR